MYVGIGVKVAPVDVGVGDGVTLGVIVGVPVAEVVVGDGVGV